MQEQAGKAGSAAERIARARQGSTAGRPADFPAEAGRCLRCGAALRIRKSKTRRVATLATGAVEARETRKHCTQCPSAPVAVSRQLAALVPPGQRYGYDLIVRVGLARYLHHLQREEIRSDLARQGLLLSTGSVSALCDRFLLALEALHWQRAPALRAAMPHGYPLHIDATCDHGKGGTFLCLAGWIGWVLHAVRITSENASELRPAVERTLDTFGDPLAVMRDLGPAGAQAVAGCRRRGIPDLLCHFHFLAAVGHKLLDGHYATLRNRISRSKVRGQLRALLRQARSAGKVRPDLPALLLWILEGEGRKHLHYPFSLPHLDFHRRCEQFPAQRDLRLPRPRTRVEQRMLRQAAEALADLRRTDPKACVSARLQQTWTVFCRLRSMLRLEEDELPRGPRVAAATPLPPGPPRPVCKPLPPTCSATTRSSAGGSHHAPPARGGASSPSASCSAIRTATAKGSPAIPWPATRRAAHWPSWTAPTMSSSSSSALPSRDCGAAWVAPIWGATWRTSRPRPL